MNSKSHYWLVAGAALTIATSGGLEPFRAQAQAQTLNSGSTSVPVAEQCTGPGVLSPLVLDSSYWTFTARIAYAACTRCVNTLSELEACNNAATLQERCLHPDTVPELCTEAQWLTSECARHWFDADGATSSSSAPGTSWIVAPPSQALCSNEINSANAAVAAAPGSSYSDKIFVDGEGFIGGQRVYAPPRDDACTLGPSDIECNFDGALTEPTLGTLHYDPVPLPMKTCDDYAVARTYGYHVFRQVTRSNRRRWPLLRTFSEPRRRGHQPPATVGRKR